MLCFAWLLLHGCRSCGAGMAGGRTARVTGAQWRWWPVLSAMGDTCGEFMIPCPALRAGQCQHPCPVGEELRAAGTGNKGVLGRQQCWQLCSAPGMAQAGRSSSSFTQDREQLVGLSAQHPWASRFVLPVLSSIRLRNGHCRVASYQPMARWPQFPPCHAGGHRASNLPFLPTLSSCCRISLFPYSVRMGPKEVNKAGGAHPNPCPHTHRSPHSQPTPAAGAEVPAGPCNLSWPCSGPSCLQCGACVDRSSGPWSLHVHGFVSIPRGATGAVLAPCHAFGFSNTWCGAGVDPVVTLMSPEILDRSVPGPGWRLPCPSPLLVSLLGCSQRSSEMGHAVQSLHARAPQETPSAHRQL